MDKIKEIEGLITDMGYAIYDCSAAQELEAVALVKQGAFLLCRGGMAVIELNMVEYTISEGWFALLSPSMVMKVLSASPDFQATVMHISPDTTLSASVGLESELFNVIFSTPCFKIADSRVLRVMTNTIDSLRLFAQLPESSHRTNFIHSCVHNIYIVLYDSRLLDMERPVQRNSSYSSADTYFRQFLMLVKEHCRTHHDVAFYADKLHITPKYLNEISRRKAHTTAKEVITQFIVTLIKRELLISGNSVQRIAYDYNFCDQSSLGKFFKKATGMSPVDYRKSR